MELRQLVKLISGCPARIAYGSSASSDIRHCVHLTLVDTCDAPTSERALSPIPGEIDRRSTPKAYAARHSMAASAAASSSSLGIRPAAPGAMTHKPKVPAVCGGAMGCNVSPGAAASPLIQHAAAGPGVAVGHGAAGTPGPRPPGCTKRRSYVNLGDT